MSWTLAASSLAGSQIAEIDNASEREISMLLGRTNTVTFQIPSSSELTNALATTGILIDAYDGAVHRFRGRVLTVNRVANENTRTMSIMAADPSWVFPKRLVGKSAAGFQSAGAQDRGLIVKNMIDAANAERHTGVRTGVLDYLANSIVSYNAGSFKPLSTAIGELATGIYGFDWTIVPVTGVDNVIGDWAAAPIIGTSNPDVVFHYIEGGGGNMKEITDTIVKTTQATRVYHFLDPGVITTNAPLITSTDDPTVSGLIVSDGLYEDVVSATLYDNTLRQQLVDEHVQVRRFPRRVITFRPQDYDPSTPGTVPRFGIDYDLGDVVRARAEDEHGEWFDAYFRVYGWTAKPTSEGLETGELLLINEAGDPGVS